jgi:serine/threonine protein kinase/tetratricopeptide (TPR) repeat protein
MPDHQDRIQELVRTSSQMSPELRAAYLTEACAGDTAMQAEVEALLASGQTQTQAPELNAFAPGQKIAERYRIVRMLGSGGMGEVYEAEDEVLRGRVALKAVLPEKASDQQAMSRFYTEIQLSRQITHPNVCRVFDIGRHQLAGREFVFFTMELLHGETLSARIRREGKFSPEEALPIALQLCEGLAAAHRAGVIHRDFKSGNIILIEAGGRTRAVITDFGLARGQAGMGDPEVTKTHTGMVMGTPAYIAPEQLLGEDATTASDIYSFGIVLYEMIAGERPFASDSSWASAMKRLRETPSRPSKIVPGIGGHWDQAILKCLEPDPASRFATAEDVAAALQPTRAKGWRQQPVRSRMLVLAILFATLTGALIFWRVTGSSKRIPDTKHLAVLPFKSVGADAADQALSDGIVDSLTNSLVGLQPFDRSLWVVPGSQIRNQPIANEAAAARTLGVNLILTGTLQRDDKNIHLSTRLQDAASLRVLRNVAIDEKSTSISKLRPLLLEKTVEMLALNVPPSALQVVAEETHVPGAYEFYERGRGYLQHFGEDNVDHAIALFEKAIQNDPGFAAAHAQLGWAHFKKYQFTKQQKWLDAAQQSCTRALQINPNLASSHFILGELNAEAGNVDQAVAEYQVASRLDPSDSEILTELARLYDRSNNLLLAEKTFQTARSLNLASWIAYNDLGSFYYRHAQYAQALPLFETVTELAPDNPLGLYNLGGVYLALGKYDDAVKVLTHAIDVKPAAGAYSNLGTAYFHARRYQAAMDVFAKATALRPSDHRLWRNLAEAQAAAGQTQAALKSYGTAAATVQQQLRAHPNDADLLASGALYKAHLGDRESAREDIGKALRLAPSQESVLSKAGLVYEAIGDRQRALEAIGAAIRAGYSPDSIADSPELEKLRSDPNYRRLLGARAPPAR